MPGGLFSGEAPSYQQISPESTMTESQKAMQQYLTAFGKMGSEQGMKAFDPERAKRSNAFYNATLAAIQGGGMGMNPKDINAAVAQTMASQPANTEATSAPATSFAGDPNMDEALALADYKKFKTQNINSGFNPELERKLSMFGDKATVAHKLVNGDITPEMIEAYRRQKQAADDAALLAKKAGK